MCASEASAGGQAATTSAADLAQLKEELVKMSGTRNGNDLSAEEVAAVVEHLGKFEGLGRSEPAKMKLAGTKWRVLFTDTAGEAWRTL